MKAAVIGLGQFGAAAARALAQSGVDTIAIDSSPGVVDAIKDEVTLAVCTDATQQRNLEEQGVGEVDLLVAGIGDDFEAQILVIVLAKQLGVPRVIARCASDVHARVLRAIGVDEIVFPEREAAQGSILRALLPAGGVPVSLGGGLCVVEVPAQEGLTGRTLADQAADTIEMHSVALFGLRPEASGSGSRKLMRAQDRLAQGDSLLLVGEEAHVARAVAKLGAKD